MKASLLFFIFIAACGVPLCAQEKVHPTGYTDTPQLPNAKWKVHDDARPRPAVVTPGKTDSAPPSDALVLFDGKDLAQFRKADGSAANKPIAEAAFAATSTDLSHAGDIFTREEFGDCQLHIEWQTPNPPQSNSQHRGNSGIFMMNRYEIQVLDCHDNKTYADGQAGSIYGEIPPMVNAMRPPGEWQTNDIIWEAPRFEGEKLTRPARVTIFHNGVCVQHAAEPFGPTGHRSVQLYKSHPPKAPIRIQDHKDLPSVKYRNIWIRPIKPAE